MLVLTPLKHPNRELLKELTMLSATSKTGLVNFCVTNCQKIVPGNSNLSCVDGRGGIWESPQTELSLGRTGMRNKPENFLVPPVDPKHCAQFWSHSSKKVKLAAVWTQERKRKGKPVGL